MSPRVESEALRYLDPAVLARLGNLELIARVAVEGFFQGLHRSPFHGLSVEYSDHRPYMQGDEIRFLDWKAYARTDHLVIKRYRQETNLRCHLLVDASASMGFGSDGVRKIDYACFLAAALAHMMLGQNDGVGLTVFDGRVRTRIPPRSNGTHLHPLLVALARAEPGGETALERMLHDIAEATPRRGLVILLSDLLGEPEDVLHGIAHLRHDKHDVIVFHVLDDAELTFPYDGMTEFRDPESEARLRTFPESVREGYRRRIEAFVEAYREGCGRQDVDYCLLNTARPLAGALAAYLSRRGLLH